MSWKRVLREGVVAIKYSDGGLSIVQQDGSGHDTNRECVVLESKDVEELRKFLQEEL